MFATLMQRWRPREGSTPRWQLSEIAAECEAGYQPLPNDLQWVIDQVVAKLAAASTPRQARFRA